MIEKSQNSNVLKDKVLNLKRKSSKNISWNTDSFNFPKLSDSFIRDLTFGVYQIKQAKSYTK